MASYYKRGEYQWEARIRRKGLRISAHFIRKSSELVIAVRQR